MRSPKSSPSAAQAQAELDDIGAWETKTGELEEQEELLLRQIGLTAEQLSSARRTAAKIWRARSKLNWPTYAWCGHGLELISSNLKSPTAHTWATAACRL